MVREYNFDLPHHFSAFEVRIAPARLRAAGVWDDLPEDFRNMIDDAIDNGESLDITQEELDTIDDVTWDKISHLFS